MSEDSLLHIGAFARDLVVQAGAGTGKTHALVTLYLHLVTGLHERGQALSPSEIVVITFTDKAAGELRERIASRMETLYEQGLAAEPSLRAMAERLGKSASRETVRAALAALHRAPVGTFHAMGHAMLKRHALQAGLDPSFVLLDGVEQQARELEAARVSVLAALEADDAAVEELVATLGFGGRERTGLLERLAALRAARAEEGRDAPGMAAAYESERVDEELRAARRELRSALRTFGELGDLVKLKTAEKAARLAALAAAPELEDLAGTAEVIRAIREHARNMQAADKRNDELRPIRARLDDAIDALSDATASIAAAPRARAIERLVGDTERRYVAAKRADGVVDFADLLRLPRDLLRDRPAVRAEERARVSALLVDEFQDTNRVQSELVALLAGDPNLEGGRSFYVGDRKQSIYEFRGADVAVFTEVTSALVAGGAGELFLRTSFRSTPRVVASSNALFARAFGKPARPEAWALSFDEERDGLVAHRDDVADGGAQLLRCSGEESEKPTAAQQRRREAGAIAAHMTEALASGRRPRELALLLRRYTNLQTYLHALRLAQIPHYVVQGRGYFAAQEIRDVASLLLLLEDVRDRFALAAVLRSPLCGLSDDGLASLVADDQLDLRHLESGISAPLSAADRRALAQLTERLAVMQELDGAVAPSVMLRHVIDAFDLAVVLAGTAGGQQKIANLEQLVVRTATLETEPRSGVADLPGFTRWLSRAVRPQATREGADAQIVDERDDVVRVMTIHQSKGLQFPVVFVADCGAKVRTLEGAVFYDAAEGLGIKIPGDKPGTNLHTTASRRVTAARIARQRAESMRLFYVAATRAQDRVVFSGERRSRTEQSWRSELDAFADAHPDLVTPVDATNAPRAAIVTGSRSVSTVDVGALAAWHPFQPETARTLRVAVTQLADFSICPRRFHFLHELRVPAPTRVRPRLDVRLDDLVPDDLARHDRDPLRSGVLAHLLLERCTFGLSDEATFAELQRLLREEGYDPNGVGPAEVASHVRAFLRSEFARALGPRALRRELPFVLPLETAAGSVRLLSGQLDLAVLDSDGVSVVDYKHAERSDVAAYRFQLEAYALAVARLYPRAPHHRVGLVFLRDEAPEPVWVDLEPLPVLAQRFASVMETLAQAKLRNQRALVPLATCRAIDCAYLPMCHPEQRA